MLVGYICQTAHAYEGDLILPESGESAIVFDIRNGQSDIDPTAVFQVFVGNSDACCEGRSPMAGHYSINKRTVTFVPAFDLIEGQNYTVKTSGEGVTESGAGYLKEFAIKRSIENVSPEIVAIYPSGPNIPENTLRFYIHFSTPMKPHVSTDYIKLVDANGMQDNAAFMAFKQELWSEDRKRLTILMDPGRIKRGVAQNLTLGPALQEGGAYSIVVEAGWPTANNSEKLPRYENAFFVSQSLRTLPDPNLWTIVAPKKRSNDPLVVEFDRPFDHALLQNRMSVLDEGGRPISGAVSIENQETTWRFEPKGAWRHSQIQIVIDTELEDVAGNNFIDLLDHSLDTVASTNKQKTITVNLAPSLN